ncbi:hypothetical protein THAOC_24062, partial [Thalassiosira oceanica]
MAIRMWSFVSIALPSFRALPRLSSSQHRFDKALTAAAAAEQRSGGRRDEAGELSGGVVPPVPSVLTSAGMGEWENGNILRSITTMMSDAVRRPARPIFIFFIQSGGKCKWQPQASVFNCVEIQEVSRKAPQDRQAKDKDFVHVVRSQNGIKAESAGGHLLSETPRKRGVVAKGGFPLRQTATVCDSVTSVTTVLTAQIQSRPRCVYLSSRAMAPSAGSQIAGIPPVVRSRRNKSSGSRSGAKGGGHPLPARDDGPDSDGGGHETADDGTAPGTAREAAPTPTAHRPPAGGRDGKGRRADAAGHRG